MGSKRQISTDVDSQLVTTKGNVDITADGVRWVCPPIDEEAIKRTFYNIDHWKRAAIQLAMTNRCREFGELSLNESLMARERISANLQRLLNTFVIEWGLTISLPVDISNDGNGHKTYSQV